jgi:CDP-diacylglycerol---glycerol-3-phosphate 3-phosphatidyltransferase
VRLLFDHSRGRRRTKTGSAATFVGERLDHPRVELFLHRLPQLAGIARALPSPLNELLAVCHFKVMVVDDVAVLTGANLSDEYFHCRHARVIVVRDARFADMLDGIVRIASEHSRRVRDRGATEDEPLRAPAEVGERVVAHVAAAAETARAERGAKTVTALPLFQHPRVGLAQERALLNRMFACSEGELFIHTPYTNMQADYLASLASRLASKAPRTSLLLASRHSHSFTTGRGFKALVPGFYAEREHHMHTQLRLLSKGGSEIELSYYRRPDWVFHSKGVWLRTDDETATIIGSSSFGARSVSRDFDLSVLLVTKDAQLREALAGELSTTAPYVVQAAKPEKPLSSLVTSPIVRSYM